MFDIVKVPMAFTFEVCQVIPHFPLEVLILKQPDPDKSASFFVVTQIYGDGAASSRDCFKMFNPTESGTFNVCQFFGHLLSFCIYRRVS